MATNIEIEAKVLIDEDSYIKIIELFKQYSENSYSQTNYYIDTVDFSLRKKGIGLRIRKIEGKYVVTLKTPLSEGLLEKTESISVAEYLEMKRKNIFPDIKIRSFLQMLDINIEDLRILASLTTERIDVDYDTGVFSIDKNDYAGHTDYELEKEGNNLKDAEEFLVNICEQAKIPYQINKVTKAARAFDKIKK